MKFIKTEGCVAGGMMIDDKDIRDLTVEEEHQIKLYLISKLNLNSLQVYQLLDLFEYDSYEYDDEPCDQCGDTVSTWTWEI